MNSILILEIKTAKKIDNYNVNYNDSSLPRVIEFNWCFIESIYGIEEITNNYIKPIGYEIDFDFIEKNDLNLNRLLDYGKNIKSVLDEFLQIIERTNTIVGFNLEFIIKLINSELYRNNLKKIDSNLNNICLMKEGVNLCRINLKNQSFYKYPSLNELYCHCFNFQAEETHILSVRDIHDIFYYMVEMDCFVNYNLFPLKKINKIYSFNSKPELNHFEFEEINNSNFNIFLKNELLFESVSEYRFYKCVGLLIVEKQTTFGFENYLIDINGIILAKVNNIHIDIRDAVDGDLDYYTYESRCYSLADIFLGNFHFSKLYNLDDFIFLTTEILSTYISGNKRILYDSSSRRIIHYRVNDEIIVDDRENTQFYSKRAYFCFDSSNYNFSIVYKKESKAIMYFKDLEYPVNVQYDFEIIEIFKNHLIVTENNLFGIYLVNNAKFAIPIEHKQLIFKYDNKNIEMKDIYNFLINNSETENGYYRNTITKYKKIQVFNESNKFLIEISFM